MKTENVIVDKSYKFALRVIKLYKYLANDKKEYFLSKQIVRSGTSIGANIEEAIGGHSEKDFLAKLTIAYKEARETHYWLRLLKDSEYLEDKLAISMIEDCDEIMRIISSIQKTVKAKESKKEEVFNIRNSVIRNS